MAQTCKYTHIYVHLVLRFCFYNEKRATDKEVTSEMDALRDQYRNKLGGRVLRIGTGGAPTAPHVKKWMQAYAIFLAKRVLVDVNMGAVMMLSPPVK